MHALERLHFCQHVAQVFTMKAIAAAFRHPTIIGTGERGITESGVDSTSVAKKARIRVMGDPSAGSNLVPKI